MKKNLHKLIPQICLILFAFSSGLTLSQTFTFSNAGASGRFGPSQGQCDAAYGVGVVTVNTQGIQEWVVPFTGAYSLLVKGASGGDTWASIGGMGRSIYTEVNLTAGQIINIVVGQEGQWNGVSSDFYGGSGGGGSFVYTGSIGGGGLIVAAGGGGGGLSSTVNSLGNNANANYTANGNNVNIMSGYISLGGIAGNGGGFSNRNDGYTLSGGPGTGWYSDYNPTYAWTQPQLGGTRFNGGALNNIGVGSPGGFGGGGAASCVNNTGSNWAWSGGGGGYSGGGAGGNGGQSDGQVGGGAGSFVSGTNSMDMGANNGNGSVVITSLCSPTIMIFSNPSLPQITEECELTNPTTPTAVNDCGAIINGISNVTFPINSQGLTVITWTYNDGQGNMLTQTQDVLIDDQTAPIPDVVSLEDIVAECSVTNLTPPTGADNCSGTITVSSNAILPITNGGTTIITWTYTDENGNESTQDQNIIISDNIAPTADIITLENVVVECEATTLTPPTATDNCSANVLVTNDAILPISTIGTTIVTWTYADGNGNTSTQEQNIIVSDDIVPEGSLATLPDITASCTLDALTDPIATDNCSGTVLISNDAVLPITTVGTTIVTWTYDDGNGNTSMQTQNVIIECDPGSIESLSTPLLSIYPNPSFGSFTVNGPFENTIGLYNEIGQLIQQFELNMSNGFTTTITNLTSGIYFLKSLDNGLVLNQKVVVN